MSKEVKLGDAHLMLGDCINLMQYIPDASVDMVLCDLPYGTTNCRWDILIPFGDLWKQYNRICRGAVLLFAQTPFDKVLGASNIANLRYEWIWEKTLATGHLNAKKSPLKAHENVLVFYKGQPTYNPIKTQGHTRKTATKRKDKTQVYGKQSFAEIPYDSTERYPRSVLTFPSDRQTSSMHDTQKPVALCEYLIQTYTNPGETVLDNTMGSASTGVACLRTKRRFIGMDNDAQHFETACRRIEEELRQPNLFTRSVETSQLTELT